MHEIIRKIVGLDRAELLTDHIPETLKLLNSWDDIPAEWAAFRNGLALLAENITDETQYLMINYLLNIGEEGRLLSIVYQSRLKAMHDNSMNLYAAMTRTDCPNLAIVNFDKPGPDQLPEMAFDIEALMYATNDLYGIPHNRFLSVATGVYDHLILEGAKVVGFRRPKITDVERDAGLFEVSVVLDELVSAKFQFNYGVLKGDHIFTTTKAEEIAAQKTREDEVVRKVEPVMTWEVINRNLDHHDYPTAQILRNGGIPTNTFYNYVSSSFLDGYVNYLENKTGYLLNRYGLDDEDIREYKLDEHAMQGSEAMYQAIAARYQNEEKRDQNVLKYDDVIVFAETEWDFWIFWFDRDVSDCSIARINKGDFQGLTREHLEKIYIENVVGNLGINYHTNNNEDSGDFPVYGEIQAKAYPLGKLGWVGS